MLVEGYAMLFYGGKGIERARVLIERARVFFHWTDLPRLSSAV
jgi:hypothetical protein